MSFFTNLTSVRSKRKYMYNLIAIAKADGMINIKENEFLLTKAIAIDISPDLLKTLIEDGSSITTPSTESMEERMSYLKDIVDMAMIDGELHEKEKTLCISICNKLRLDEGYLRELIDDGNVEL